MKVLGLSPLDKDSTVTLVEDGKVTYAAAEERFTRTKLQDGFPWQALQAALDTTGVRPQEIDRVVYPFFTWERETELFQRNLANEREFLDSESFRSDDLIERALSRVPKRSRSIPGLSHPNERMEKSFAKKLAYRVLANESVISRNVAKRASDQCATRRRTTRNGRRSSRRASRNRASAAS
jgi:carbamoyltransferase